MLQSFCDSTIWQNNSPEPQEVSVTPALSEESATEGLETTTNQGLSPV